MPPVGYGGATDGSVAANHGEPTDANTAFEGTDAGGDAVLQASDSDVVTSEYPSGAPSPAFWLRADRGLTLDGMNVSSWTDFVTGVSPSAYGGCSVPPVLLAGAFNGRNALHFGKNACLSFKLPKPLQLDGFTVMAVTRVTTAGTDTHFQPAVEIDDGTQVHFAWFIREGRNTMKAIANVMNNSAILYYQGVFGVGDGVTAFIGRSAPSPDQLFNVLVDGTTIPSSLSNNVTLPAVGQYSHILVGGHMGGLGFFDGDIGEVLIFDHPLSDQEESSLASYTKARWATK